MTQLTCGSLFSGIGGLELGLERAGMRTVWQVEQNEYCRKVLAKHWPDVQRFIDVRDVGAHNLPPVDLICGGFPCQDVSLASSGRVGISGERSGLWSEYVRIVSELRPRNVIVENVPGLLSDGMGRVLGDLAEIGYDAEWSVVSACALGAAHTRERVFIVSYPHGYGLEGRYEQTAPHRGPPIRLAPPISPRRGFPVLPAPRVCRGVDGVPNRVDRLRALGNAVVPQVAEFIGRLIVEAAAQSRSAA